MRLNHFLPLMLALLLAGCAGMGGDGQARGAYIGAGAGSGF